MRFLISLTLLFLTACHHPQPDLPHGMDLSASDRTQLERNAANGDSEAAFRLFYYYEMVRQDVVAAHPWLRRAAELDLPEAQRTLAFYIRDYNFSYKGFGESAPVAVKNLLERSARTNYMACFELALAYEDGYFGAPDSVNARLYFERGAGLGYVHCWPKIAYYCHNGIGGPKDDASAYYWISLAASWIDAISITGQEVWRTREDIATHLSFAEIEIEWRKIDAFIAGVEANKIIIDSNRFGKGSINAKDEEAARALFMKLEDAHRNKCKNHGA